MLLPFDVRVLARGSAHEIRTTKYENAILLFRIAANAS